MVRPLLRLQTNCRFTAGNLLYKCFQIIPCSKYLLPVKIRKAVNRKENVRGLRRDLSVLALPPGPAAGTHLMSNGINDFAAVWYFLGFAAEWEKGISRLCKADTNILTAPAQIVCAHRFSCVERCMGDFMNHGLHGLDFTHAALNSNPIVCRMEIPFGTFPGSLQSQPEPAMFSPAR